MAEKMAASKLGVVAYGTSGDRDTGDYDEEPVMGSAACSSHSAERWPLAPV
jgi:hypothetical protein